MGEVLPGDYDEPDVWRVERVKSSRRRWRCGTCGAELPPGSEVVKTIAISDGSSSTEAACVPCADLAKKVAETHRFRPFPSYLAEFVEECSRGTGEWAEELVELDRRRARVGVPL